MKISFFDTKPYDVSSFEKFDGESGLTFKYFETKLTRDTCDLAIGSDAVCIFVNDTADSSVIDRLAELGVKIIALRCAGFNNVDLSRARERGIAVLHVPAYSPYAVAEHAMALLLCSVRRIHKAFIRSKEFNFSLTGLTGMDLHGKTVGVIGTGRIGKAFISICKGFGMNILAYDKYPDATFPVTYTDTDTIFKKCDILSLHCPLNEETYHMVNEHTIGMMKRGVIIINTSRGALVDASALLDSIKDRRIGAACLDVYEEESDVFFTDHSGHILDDDTLARLISMPNVIVTSHQAFLTEEALGNIAETTVRNILDLTLSGSCKNDLSAR